MSNFKNDILKAHNSYRKNHAAPALKWSSKLEANAQKWAKELAKKGYLQHASQSEEGENIACLKGAELTGGKATEMWYEEIKDYDFNNPGFKSSTGHFTQVVWASSLELGVGKATASNGMQFVVARYYPAGNMLRRFPENVKRSGSKPTTNGANTNSNNNNSNNNNNNNNRTTTAKPTAKPTQPSKPPSERQTPNNFKNDFLRTHNKYRKRHGTAPLIYSSRLAKMASQAAEDAAKTNTLRSIDANDVGQNMAAMTGGELSGERVSTMWYEEETKYNYNSPGFSSSTGSFSQLVWKGSQEVGVGRAFGAQGQTFVIAVYKPPGNIRGQYAENVSRSSGPLPDVSKEETGSCCVIL